MTIEERECINNCFVAYCDMVKACHSITDYKLLKCSGLHLNLLYKIRKGEYNRFGLSLSCFFAVYRAFLVPFHIEDYDYIIKAVK